MKGVTIVIMAYILAFCRIAIGLVFLLSGIGKARNLARFRQTINSFRLLPERFSSGAALLFLLSEFAVVVLMLIGGPCLLPSFLLAALLLAIFCAALASVLARAIKTSCNCFGSSEQEVSGADLWRNGGLILCALCGCSTQIWTKGNQVSLNFLEWGLVALGASAFILIWLQLGEIARLFQQG